MSAHHSRWSFERVVAFTLMCFVLSPVASGVAMARADETSSAARTIARTDDLLRRGNRAGRTVGALPPEFEPSSDRVLALAQVFAQATTPNPVDSRPAVVDPEDLDEPNEVAFPTYDEEPPARPAPRGLTPFLPIWGDAVREEGFELPLPLGLSVNYVHLERDIDVKDIKVRVGNGPSQSVNQFLNVGADSGVDTVIGRLDAWILPFLNVYGYAGYQRNHSNINVAVSLPTPGPAPPLEFVVADDGVLEGPVYGTGFALAGGYEAFFVTATFDFAFAELDEFDSDFEGRIYGVRSGWNGEIGEIPTRVWTGFSYFDTETKVEGSANLPNVGPVRFEVKQGPENPWNGVLGVSISVPFHVDLMAEYGFNFDDVQMFTGGATFRF